MVFNVELQLFIVCVLILAILQSSVLKNYAQTPNLFILHLGFMSSRPCPVNIKLFQLIIHHLLILIYYHDHARNTFDCVCLCADVCAVSV